MANSSDAIVASENRKARRGRPKDECHGTKKDGSIPDELPAKAAHANGKMKQKVYEKELHKLQLELCRLQDWVKETGERIIILFEGRDAAGKGGTIKAINERVNPRVFRVVALAAPSDRKKTQIASALLGVVPQGRRFVTLLNWGAAGRVE
jgi:polyphosphate kinase 2 (PPK2 family)